MFDISILLILLLFYLLCNYYLLHVQLRQHRHKRYTTLLRTHLTHKASSEATFGHEPRNGNGAAILDCNGQLLPQLLEGIVSPCGRCEVVAKVSCWGGGPHTPEAQ